MINPINLFKVASTISIVSTNLVDINKNLKDKNISKHKRYMRIMKTSGLSLFLIVGTSFLGDYLDDSIIGDVAEDLFKSEAFRV